MLEPFAGWVVRPRWAPRVVSGVYDAHTPAQRRAIAAAEPYSYFNVTRSYEDVDGPVDLDTLVGEGAVALRRLLDADVFAPSGRRTLYAYRLGTGHGDGPAHHQLGVVGLVPVAAFTDRRIRLHEGTRPERTTLLSRHFEVVGAQSSPIAVTFRHVDAVTEVLEAASTRSPLLAHRDTGGDGTWVSHEVWELEPSEVEAVTAALADTTMYVTDGHHRAAAAVDLRRRLGPSPVRDRALAAVFPDTALRVDAFHRLAPRPAGMDTDALVAALTGVGILTEVAGPDEARPGRAGTVGVHLEGRWFRLDWGPPTSDDPVERLDVERLRQRVLVPVLGVDEGVPGSPMRYLPDPTGVDELVRICREEGCVGFLVHPVGVDDLMAVADADRLMPPKSSYFTPKPRSGIFLRVLGTGATAHLPAS
ncbi:MAG: DUF1015 domain-containing protein [Actinomyces sp.]|nr:MAG: DUF1015 domain-containing protein [Actinomyces sp.]